MVAAVIIFMLSVIGPKPESLPSLSGRSGNFTVEQSGHRLTFRGDSWSGTGEISGDLVRVVWIQCSENGDNYAVGIYQRDGRTLAGQYGYVGTIEIHGWTILGDCLHSEVIRIEP